MSEAIYVYPASADDLTAILELLIEADLPVRGLTGAEGFLVGKRGGAVVGAVCAEDYGDEVLLRSLVVAPDARMDGVGSTLVRQFVENARRAGKARVHLLTLGAAGYFEELGFTAYPISDIPPALTASGEYAGCATAGATAMMLKLPADGKDAGEMRRALQRKYADIAALAKSAGSGCCGPSAKTQVTSNLYSGEQEVCLPVTAVDGSRGCGNPTAISALNPGEIVLDLGSGAGADAMLAALKVGQHGKVYGLDITEEMLELARQGQAEVGIDNVEFIRGEIEDIPLPAQAVDVVISNCVISLAPDKDKVFGEITRVLKPGGRIALSDIVSTADLPAALRDDLTTWLGCLGGALEIETYREKLKRAGMSNIRIEITRVYDLPELLAKEDHISAALATWKGQVCAASVTATLEGGAHTAGAPGLAAAGGRTRERELDPAAGT